MRIVYRNIKTVGTRSFKIILKDKVSKKVINLY